MIESKGVYEEVIGKIKEVLFIPNQRINVLLRDRFVKKIVEGQLSHSVNQFFEEALKALD